MPRDIFRLAFRANMSAEEDDTGELMLYGEIIPDMSAMYKGQYPNDKSASDFDKAVKELKSKGARKLKLRINSPGGVVTEAVAMRGTLTGAGFEKIDIRIEGMCASAATLVASIPGARVEITPGSEYMIHNPWSIALGSASDMEKTAAHLRQIEQVSRGFYAQKSGQSEEQIKRWMDAETWFTAEDAVRYGFADELAQEGGVMAAVACVTEREMAAMKGLYKAVPEEIGIVNLQAEDEETEETDCREAEPSAATQEEVSNEATKAASPPAKLSAQSADGAVQIKDLKHATVAGNSTEIKDEEETETMEIKDLTQEQLLAENPALVEQIQQAAIAAEAQRREDIDAITPPQAEYQAMADEAKKNGTSVLEFQKQLVAAMKKKGADHMAARQAETAPAQNVAGGAAEDEKDEDQEIKQYAESIAKYAKEYRGGGDGSMF